MADQLQGVRYPKLGFWTSGQASTEQGFGPHPYETFSFDSALLMAKIQDFNIAPYSSVLPIDVRIISVDEAQKSFFHGAVLEVILAEIGITYSAGSAKRNIGIRTHGRQYVTDSEAPVLSAASCVGMQTGVEDKDGKIVGGYVAEYVDTFPTHVGSEHATQEATSQLNQALDHICNIRGLSPTSGKRSIEKVSYVEVSKEQPYGYTLNGYGFLNFGVRPSL